MAMAPAYTLQKRYSCHTGGGGIQFGGPMTVSRPDPPTPYEVPVHLGGGTVGKGFGGIGSGWKPKPAHHAIPFIAGKPQAPETLTVTSYYVDTNTVQGMSYTVPAFGNMSRRLKADGIQGEFESAFGPAHRSIGGHEAFPADSPRAMRL